MQSIIDYAIEESAGVDDAIEVLHGISEGFQRVPENILDDWELLDDYIKGEIVSKVMQHFINIDMVGGV